MKTKSLLIGLLLAGILTASYSPKLSADNDRKRSSCVVMGYQGIGYTSPTPDQWGNHNYVQTGMVIVWVDRSQHAPTITNGAPLAQSVASCLEAGMAIIYDKDGRIMLAR